MTTTCDAPPDGWCLPTAAPGTAGKAAAEFSLRTYARGKNWALEAKRAAGFTVEIALQTFLFFWIGGALGSLVDRLSRRLSRPPTPEERATGRVDRAVLARDLCLIVPLLATSFILVRTLTVWGYEKAVFRRLLHRYAPEWFHYEAFRIHGAYAMATGLGWTSPTTSAKAAAFFGVGP
jgi:hypothetical protein